MCELNKATTVYIFDIYGLDVSSVYGCELTQASVVYLIDIYVLVLPFV